MKPKPPPSNVPNPTTKPTSNRPQRAVKIPVRKQNGETSKSKKDKLKDDLSVLMKSISTSVTSLQEIIKLFKNATPEIIDLITNECSIILECKICKNLFRSLANFMTHKRGFCLGKFEELFQYHEHTDHMWYSKCRKNKMLSSRSTTRKDILELIESMKGSIEFETAEATVLQDLKTTNEGLFNLRYSSQDPAKDERKVFVNPEESPEDEEELTAIDSSKCTFCQKDFPSLKALNSHVKKNHGGLRMSFVCPCCKKYFANTWSVYRHLYKVHRKTSEQVRKLRNQIQKKQVTVEELERSKKGHNSQYIDEKDQEKAFMEDLKGHGSLQRCPDCGKRFDRKVALISHASHCHKKLNSPPDPLNRPNKRKAHTPLKVEQEKKSKYSAEELYQSVVLTEDDMICCKKERMDDYEMSHSSNQIIDISSFVQVYQGSDETISCNENEEENLLNKLFMEVNIEPLPSVVVNDSDRDDNDCESSKSSLDAPESGEKEDSQDDASGILESNQYNSQEEEDTENENEDEIQRNNEGDSNSEEAESYNELEAMIISDVEFEHDVLQENDDEQDPLELQNEQDISIQDLETSNEQDVTIEEEVVEGNIVIQDFINDNSYIIIDDNIIVDSETENKSVNNDTIVIETHSLDDSVEENCSVEISSEAHEESLGLELRNNGITISSHQTEGTDTVEDVEEISRHSDNVGESDEFEGFSDVEDNSNHISQQHLSITNNRNKIMLKEFDKLSVCQKNNNSSQKASTSFGNNFLQESSFDGLTKGMSQDYDSLSMRYDLDDGNYIVAKEIVLFNDSDGVCISNMSNSEVLEESLKHSISPSENDQVSTKRYFSKLNGGSPSHRSTSPQTAEIEDDGDSVVDGSDWVTKKINSLMNGQKKKCLLCLKTFHKVVFVRRHVASHFNINKFKCLVNCCNFQSFLRADMNSHLTKVHKKKEVENFVERLYPRKEDFDRSLYNADPKSLHPFEKSYKTVSCDGLNVVEVPGNETKYSNSIILEEESLDGLNICEEMELPCLEESPTKLLRYEALDDDVVLPPLQDQEPGPMKSLALDVLFGNNPGNSQDSTPTES